MSETSRHEINYEKDKLKRERKKARSQSQFMPDKHSFRRKKQQIREDEYYEDYKEFLQ